MMASLKKLLARKGADLTAEWLVVGLGNAGPGHAGDRHNIGFEVVNKLATRASVRPVRLGGTMTAAVGEIAGHKTALVKPLTMVNLSGKAVAQAIRATGCDIHHTIVVYDDLDTETAALRIRAGGGSGGHNGLKSIVSLAGADFIRVKIGIGRPRDVDGKPTWDPEYVADYVLSAPQGPERQLLLDAVEHAADAIETIISEGVDLAISRYNRKTGQPARAKG